MPYPPGPWVRASFFFENEEREWQNVLWWTVSGTPAVGFNINTLASDIDTHFGAVFADTLQVAFANQVGLRVYYNNGTYTFGQPRYNSRAGNEVSSEIPTESAVIVRQQSDHGGPSGRGRLYLSGVCSANVSVSRVSSAGITLYGAIVTALNGTIVSQGLTLTAALFSRHDSVLRTITSHTLEGTLGHRKKRRPVF